MNVEKENTMRALQDKPLLARKQWWCAFSIHTWMPWKMPVVNKRGAWTFVEQFRSCGHCGVTQRRVLSKD